MEIPEQTVGLGKATPDVKPEDTITGADAIAMGQEILGDIFSAMRDWNRSRAGSHRRDSNHANVRQRWQRRLEAWSDRLAENPFKRAWRAIAVATLVLTVAGGVLVRLTDPEVMTSIGTGLWWALQTVTTVGYGDVVPNSTAGRLTAAVVMLAGLSLLAVTTAAVSNAFVQAAARRRGRGRDDPVLAELTALRAELAQLRSSIITTALPPPHPPPEPGPPGTGGNA